MEKVFYYSLTIFHNMVINKIPSRHFSRITDRLMGARIGKGSFLFRRVEVLFPKGLNIGEHCNVGWFSLLDARGGIKVGNNVTIASYVKLVTGSHNINSGNFEAEFLLINIDCCGRIYI